MPFWLCENRSSTGTRLTQRQKAEAAVFTTHLFRAEVGVDLAVTLQDSVWWRLYEGQRTWLSGTGTVCLESRVGWRFPAIGRREPVAASFLHTSSRALDPQLHTHFTVFNATQDPTSAVEGAQAGPMYAAIRYATRFTATNCSRGQAIGYRTVPVRDWFEIEGVGERLIQRFSKRSTGGIGWSKP
jgi:hypothetical protein